MDFFASLFAEEDSEDEDEEDEENADPREIEAKKRKLELDKAAQEREDMIQTQISIIQQINSLDASQYAEILGVSELADEDEIRRQYRKLAILIHPDKCKLEGANNAFQTLKKAHDIILGGVDPNDPNTEKILCPGRECRAPVYMEKEKHALLMRGGDTGYCRVCKVKFGRVFCCHCFAAWTMEIDPQRAGKLLQCSKCKKKFAIVFPSPAVRKDVSTQARVEIASKIQTKKPWWVSDQ